MKILMQEKIYTQSSPFLLFTAKHGKVFHKKSSFSIKSLTEIKEKEALAAIPLETGYKILCLNLIFIYMLRKDAVLLFCLDIFENGKRTMPNL